MMTVGDFFDEENKLLKGNSYRYDCVHIQDLAGEIAHMGINCDNLPNAMKNIVKFINTNDGMNELVKASIIHFYIAYLNPYFDGTVVWLVLFICGIWCSRVLAIHCLFRFRVI